MKRAAAGGYPVQITDGDPVTVAVTLGPTVGSADAVVARVRSLLNTWKQFGTGGEDNAINELQKALGDPHE